MALFQPIMIHYDSLPSTNTEAAAQARKGAPEGLSVIASEQTAGRGRLQRHWVSPRGAGLYFSIVLRPKLQQRHWPLITLAAALAVHDALMDACGIQADIKWPNDVVIGDRKICGILAEALDTHLGPAVIVGIGINLTSDSFPPDVAKTATSVAAATSKAPDREGILRALIGALEQRYLKLQGPKGREETIRAWSKRSSYASGKRVCVADSSETIEGVARGLDEEGGLLVETDTGEVKIVRAGDVTVVKESEFSL